MGGQQREKYSRYYTAYGRCLRPKFLGSFHQGAKLSAGIDPDCDNDSLSL